MADSKKTPLDEATLIKTPTEEKSKGHYRAPEAYPLVEIQSGPKQGRYFSLLKEKDTLIGRAPNNDFVLEDNSVSRSHARVFSLDGQWFTQDIGSRNGTFINKQPIHQDETPLAHGDLIKVGIYILRYLDHAEEQEDFSEPEEIPAESLSIAAPQPPVETPKPLVVEKSEKKSLEPKVKEAISIPLQKTKTGSSNAALKWFLVFLLLGGSGAGGYWGYQKYFSQKTPVAQNPESLPTVTPTVLPGPSLETKSAETQVANNPPPVNPETKPPVITPPTPDEKPDANAVPILIEVKSQPISAKIFFQGKELGVTPFSSTILVPIGVPQELTATYRFDELNQEWSTKKSFQISKQDEIVSLSFDNLVGNLKFKNLPKGVEVYLEGSFASNELKSQAAKISELNFKRPVALPFGKYVFELKKDEAVASSETVVRTVKYRREFVLNSENLSYEVNVSEQDIQNFAVSIQSTPSGADIYVDDKKYGKTPFQGHLPLGKHRLILKKEGWNDYEEALEMAMNVPVTKEIKLATTEAGQFMNKGREMMVQTQFKEAIDQFGEALKKNPTPTETGQIHILLGTAHLRLKAYQVAMGYFEKAKVNPDFKSQGDLGIAEAQFGMGNSGSALTTVINIMVNGKDEKIISQAEDLFRRISPLKSVILVSTDPKGARVFFNNQEVAKTSPVLLSDLPLGGHKIRILKEGCKPYESRVQLSISAFKPVIVKLECQN